jgi:glycosyltransferase involved in cell wall biosynthesis
MKILHVLSQKPGFTGSGFYLRALLSQSAQKGFQTACVVGLNVDDEADLEPVYAVRFDTEDLPFPVVGMSDVMPYRSTRWSDLAESDLLKYENAFKSMLTIAVSEFQPDVIHCHHFWLLSALTRHLFPHHRVVVSCHGTGLRQQQKLPELGNRFLDALAQIDHGFCLTEDQLQSLAYLGDRASVVGAGFDPEVFHGKGRTGSEQFRVLYAGKISQSKGCHELLDAVEPLLGDHFVLSMAGSGHGAEADLLVEKGEQLGVRMLGRLSQAELAEEMRQSDLFILPSYYEGLALVLAEALSCGCQVISTALPGLQGWLPPEFVDTGWVSLVDLPRLEHTDRPVESDLPAFVARLRDALEFHRNSNPERPPSLDAFLQGNSWSGVFGRISAHYGEQG